jgi:hypothetical protein
MGRLSLRDLLSELKRVAIHLRLHLVERERGSRG